MGTENEQMISLFELCHATGRSSGLWIWIPLDRKMVPDVWWMRTVRTVAADCAGRILHPVYPSQLHTVCPGPPLLYIAQMHAALMRGAGGEVYI